MKPKHTPISLRDYIKLKALNKLPPKYTLQLTDEEVSEIDSKLKNSTYKQVSHSYDINSSSILQRALTKVGYSNKYNRVRAKFNERYFKEIDTPEKAYILGFIAADGCVYRNTLSIEVAEKDKSVLEFIKSQFGFDKELDTNIRKGKVYCKIRITSSRLKNDLNRLGITERKTFDIKFIRLKDECLQRHLIHG